MKVINQTRKSVLAQDIIVPKSVLEKSLGLLNYKSPTAMLFDTHFGIHTFAMRYAIDVLILNKDKQVVAMKENLQPNRIFLWNILYNTVLELPAGTIQKTKTLKEDIVSFI